MRVIALLALGAASSVSADPVAIADERLRQAEFDLVALHDLAGGGPRANSCGSAPLSLTPTGPRTTSQWQYAEFRDDLVRVTAWRIPCNSTESMPVLTLEVIRNGDESFICASMLTLLQAGGLQTDVHYFRTDPPTNSSFCGSVLAPVTVALFPRPSTPAAFDFDQAFSIAYDGYDAVQTISMPAYDPSQYSLTPPPGPNSVEVHVRGSGTHYRNCTVTQASQGGATQYTASCNDESPLTSRKFERFDH